MKKFIIGFILGFLVMLGICYLNYDRALKKINDELKVNADSLAVLDSLITRYTQSTDTLDAQTDSLTQEVKDSILVSRRRAAEAWRAKERARIVDSISLLVTNEAGVDTVIIVPAEVVTRIATLDTALAACQAGEITSEAALAKCNAARATKDSIIQTNTGVIALKDDVIVKQAKKIALLESKKGIDLGIFRLNLIPEVNAGYNLTYNVDCPNEKFSSSTSTDERVETVPIEYPDGWYDVVDYKFPNFDYPKEITNRTLVITNNNNRKSGCQRFVHGPGVQATLLRLTF